MGESVDGADRVPLTVEGKPAKYRSRISERQSTAQRLLMAAAEEAYSGDLDVNWDAPTSPDLEWFPMRLSSLYGSPEWKRLTAAQRKELGRHELVNVLTFGMRAEAAMTMLMFRSIAESGDLMGDVTRYTLKAIQEETRNSSMFSRVVNKTGLSINRSYVEGWLLSEFIMFVPSGIITNGLILMLQEAVHSYAAAMAADSSLQPHVRQTMRIHEMADQRHIEYSANDFYHTVASSGRLSKLVGGHVLAFLASRLYPWVLNGAVYPPIGVSPRRGLGIARAGDQYRMRARALTDSFVSHAREAGLFRTSTERLLLRRGKVWPTSMLSALLED
ncbi:hypothetical protein GOARA_005_00190 [Gordonia araii NBRC 100433]|uniref:p-aminobenzoate N-oxygenase AurF n=1 Tax=Gordonia araii NBRC 100433 TaxID=1073574 RepID=G7GX99_9ACTN|nr:diiron oxygenase [Gordonia araii]NNG98997.1 hypothetical protein [Gordonia araii NBRC 100433]GAB08224.1 hypothetical protein GOARA_005_00190 [Gordonia araii NBRC 100433]